VILARSYRPVAESFAQPGQIRYCISHRSTFDQEGMACPIGHLDATLARGRQGSPDRYSLTSSPSLDLSRRRATSASARVS